MRVAKILNWKLIWFDRIVWKCWHSAILSISRGETSGTGVFLTLHHKHASASFLDPVRMAFAMVGGVTNACYYFFILYYYDSFWNNFCNLWMFSLVYLFYATYYTHTTTFFICRMVRNNAIHASCRINSRDHLLHSCRHWLGFIPWQTLKIRISKATHFVQLLVSF